MTQITDEKLMAYADGELSASERAVIEARLAEDVDLRARIEPFQATGTALASVFDRQLYEPVPSRLIETIASAGSRGSRQGKSESAKWAPFGWLNGMGALLVGTPQFATAFAVTAVVLVGAGMGGWMLGRGETMSAGLVVADHGGLVASGALLAALDSQPSGLPTEHADGSMHVTPIQTFRNQAGTYCRQYEIVEGSGRSFEGVACRPGDAGWRVELHVESAARVALAGGSKTDQYTPSDRPPGPVDQMVDSLKKGDVLGGDDEKQALARKWVMP